ncbi:hypothetical protein [Cohaesibacter sp. CAU 1516]|uniref:hypothetical protein n=1 Tax=Cohaesibacter sp. CAU 1516 TaxID=2576038 RepID=UPI0014850D51|nr:hypothetical protein [Cohaesibacter sp. CAU 1516]
MKQSQQIASTAAIDLAPIGGRKERDFERLTDYLAVTLGPDHAAIFSEPQSSTDGTRIHWYISRSGPVARLDTLDAESADGVLSRFGRMQHDILQLADKLATSKEASDRAFGRALANAIRIPDQSYIYAHNGNPILVGWGHRLAKASVGNDEIGIRAPARPHMTEAAEMPITAPVQQEAPVATEAEPLKPATEQVETEEPNHTWLRCLTALLWLLLAGLMAAILYLLFMACAVSFLPWFSYCHQSPAAAVNLADLQREVRVLKNALAFKKENCAEDPQPGANLNNSDISNRLTQRSAGNGALQISLAWNGLADLDLAVKCNNGAVWFRSPSACGARLDTDSNGGRNNTPRPIENIVWQSADTIPAGKLPIFVTLYSHRNQPPTDIPYTIRVVRRQGDQITEQFTIEGVASRQSVKQSVPVGSANRNPKKAAK